MKDYIEKTLAPKLQGDGGWVEVTAEDGDKLTLTFRGECSKCQILSRCVDWMKAEIRRDLGRDVTIEAVRKKPYFWDNN